MEWIYSICNLQNGKKYVGKTGNIKYRKKLHFNALKANRHPNKYMQEDFNRYGIDSFSFCILETTENSFGRTYKERDWMVKLKTYDFNFGYNCNDPCFLHRTGVRTKLYKELMMKQS